MKLYLTIGLMIACGFASASENQAGITNSAPTATDNEDLIFVGDTLDQVYEMLGDPSIEFPKDGKMHRWYAGYQVVFSRDVVVSIKRTSVMTEEEKAEKAYRAEQADKRLRNAYAVVAREEQISYEKWLERERKRREDERFEKLRIEAERERQSKESREAIRAGGNNNGSLWIYSGN